MKNTHDVNNLTVTNSKGEVVTLAPGEEAITWEEGLAVPVGIVETKAPSKRTKGDE